MVTKNDLGTKDIKKLLLSLAVPGIIAQLVNIVYNMVDRIYIGNMEGGTTAMAGLAIAVPVITIIMAFTQLIGIGGAPLAAIKMGENNQDGAEKIMTNSFVLLIVSGIILTVGLYVFQEPLLYMFGADETTIIPAMQYVSIYVLGTVFVQISIGMNSYINTQGYAKFGMLTVLIGAILNIILDPIFIFGFNMKVSGAALATIISQGVSAIWVLYFFKNQSVLKIRKKYLIPDIKIVSGIAALGISPFIMTSTEGLLQISFNNQLAIYGGSLAVGTMAILMSLYQMISLPLVGVALGAQPILSYNYGSKNFHRVRETFKLAFKVCIAYSMTATTLILLFSPQFSRIFSADASAIAFSAWAVRVYLIGGLLNGAQLCCQQSFMALGQAKRSLSMALFRKIILLIPMIYIFPIILGDTTFATMMAEPIVQYTIDGPRTFAVLFSESVADILAAVTTTALFVHFYKKKLQDNQI